MGCQRCQDRDERFDGSEITLDLRELFFQMLGMGMFFVSPSVVPLIVAFFDHFRPAPLNSQQRRIRRRTSCTCAASALEVEVLEATAGRSCKTCWL